MYCTRIGEHKDSATLHSPANRATILLMIAGMVTLIVLTLLISPQKQILYRAMLVGAIMAIINYIFEIVALRRGLWTVRGAWKLFGYPLSMLFGWFFFIAGFCLFFNWLHFWWSKSAFVIIAGVGGSLWDINVHTRVGVLVIGRAKRWQIVLYWLILSVIAALLCYQWR